MFVVLLNYKTELAVVDQYRPEHWEWLDKASAAGILLTCGREVNKKNGVLLMRGTREEVEYYAANDPFVLNNVADYVIHEFEPTRTATGLEEFIR